MHSYSSFAKSAVFARWQQSIVGRGLQFLIAYRHTNIDIFVSFRDTILINGWNILVEEYHISLWGCMSDAEHQANSASYPQQNGKWSTRLLWRKDRKYVCTNCNSIGFIFVDFQNYLRYLFSASSSAASWITEHYLPRVSANARLLF